MPGHGRTEITETCLPSLRLSRHTNVVCLLGVTLRPLGLLLELAPKGSLRALLQSYAEAQMKVQCNVAQAVIVQVRDMLSSWASLAWYWLDLASILELDQSPFLLRLPRPSSTFIPAPSFIET